MEITGDGIESFSELHTVLVLEKEIEGSEYNDILLIRLYEGNSDVSSRYERYEGTG